MAESYGAAGGGRVRLLVMAAVCAAFVVSQFLRNSAGVIAPDLSRDLGFGPEQLGLLSGAFFLSFALMQIPAGMALDRYGPRATMGGLMVTAVAGCLLFAAGEGLAELAGARFAMGFGCSALLMGGLALVSRWYAPQHFAMVTGIVLAIGGLGTLGATAPLAWAAEHAGWRASFLAVAAITALVALALALAVRDAPAGHPFHARERGSLRESVAGVIEAARRRDVAPLFVMQFFSYSCYVSVLGLWGGPYLADVHGLGLAARGHVLLVMALAQGAGALVIPPLDRVFGTRKRVVATGVSVCAGMLALIGLWPQMPLAVLLPVFAVLGFAVGYNPVLIAHGRALFHERILGRGMTLLNVATMGGVFLVQGASGLIVAAFSENGAGAGHAVAGVAAYRACFLSLAAMLLFALSIYLRAGDRKPGAVEEPS